MTRTRILNGSLTLATLLVLLPVVASAQSGIAGVVKDTTGGVLPGVTVEAASPALIEKSRTVVTNTDGQYNIVDLRPGVYSVTFTLTGFSNVRREGIELTAGFTATVNGELRVGTVEETVTVSGQSPTVDIRNTIQQNVISRPLLENIPNGERIQRFAAMTPGAVVATSQLDVGGQRDDHGQFTIHGGRSSDTRRMQDGMRWNSMEGNNSASGYWIDVAGVDQITVELGGGAAEYELGGVQINVIPKTGGNRFSGLFLSNYTNKNLQSANLTDELRARGLSRTNSIQKLYDLNGAIGGPILKDKLWFFTSHRWLGTYNYIADSYFAKYHTDPEAWTYVPDLDRPGIDGKYHRHHSVRLSWQATPKQRLNIYFE